VIFQQPFIIELVQRDRFSDGVFSARAVQLLHTCKGRRTNDTLA